MVEGTDYELFEATPVNPKPTRASRSFSSLKASGSPKTSDSVSDKAGLRKSEKPDLGKLLARVKAAEDLSGRLGRGRLFYKSVSRMTLDDVAKHRQNLSDLVQSNCEIFMDWPLDDPDEIPPETKRSCHEIRETMKKLKVKIDQFEEIQEKREAMRDMETLLVPNDSFVPPSPDGMQEEDEATPPFDLAPH